ncbi:MAG: FG-GAP repeat domain-containing protein [Blastocatellia bacterium]
MADLNRDGHVDIVYGAYWFAGPDFVPRTFRPNHVSKEYMRANSDHAYDVDKDGWLDVIAGGWGEDGIYWYKNPGNAALEQGKPWEMHQPWEAHLLARTRGNMEMFALHDFDGDGVPELYSTSFRKQFPLEVWRFTKSVDGAPMLQPFVLGAEGGGHGYAFGDVNGDGREDVLCEVGWYERPAGDPFAKSWKFHGETALPHPSCPFVVKDLNQDGRLDIIFGRGHDVGLYWWEQQPRSPDGTTVWKQHVIDESWTQAHAISLADLDGDGEEELIAGKCIWAHDGGDPGAADPPAIYYYSWNRSAAKFTRHTIAAPGEGIALGRQYSVVDLNGDGRLDLTAPSKLGLWVFFNQGYK